MKTWCCKTTVKNKIISIDYMKLEMNLVDPLTKPLGRKIILETSKGMRLMLK